MEMVLENMYCHYMMKAWDLDLTCIRKIHKQSNKEDKEDSYIERKAKHKVDPISTNYYQSGG
jgi:hypothetical protein